jgi:hypothetical protein
MSRVLYKFTDSNLTTRHNTQWVLGEWKETNGAKQSLCNSSWLHAYEDPYIAAFIYPAHISYKNPRFFKAEGDGKFLSDGTKCGVTRLRLVEEIPLPKITVKQKFNIVCCCALEIVKELQDQKLERFFKQCLAGKLPSVNECDRIQQTIKYNLTNSNDGRIRDCWRAISHISCVIFRYRRYKQINKTTILESFNYDVVTIIFRTGSWFGINILSCIYKGLYIK